jgi:hypothetical protein
MKATVIATSCLFLFLQNYLSAQCLVNSDFANVPGPIYSTNSSCTYWNTGGVENWIRSHGTPSITTFSTHPLDNYVYLWAATPNAVFEGEGVFASYTCTSGISYTIQVKVNVTDPANTGYFRLYCANGLSEPPIYGCGSSLPQLPANQLYLIASNTERNQGWKVYEYTFTTSPTFNQIWIYPYTTASSQYTLLVDYVKVCKSECLNTAFYNSGQLPIGTTYKGNIFLGSSAGVGGSGTVTVSSTAQTTLIAANEIIMQPEFNAVVTTGTFTAMIEQCLDPTTNNAIENYIDSRSDINVNPLPESDSTNQVQRKKMFTSDMVIDYGQSFEIFPNPSKGNVFIRNYEKAFIKEIRVYDAAGRARKMFFNGNLNVSSMELTLQQLSPGLYYIKIATDKNVVVKKVILSK